MSRICVLLDNDFSSDDRVKIECLALIEGGHEVTLYALKGSSLLEEEEMGGIKIRRVFGSALTAPYRREWKNFEKAFVGDISSMDYDIIHCHDFNMVPMGVAIKRKTDAEFGKKIKVVYDSHEYLRGYKYYMRSSGAWNILKGKIVWNWYLYKEERSLGHIDALITVSESIIEEFKKRLPSNVPTELIRNMPSVVKRAQKGQKYFHDHFDLPHLAKLIIHTGNTFFSEERYRWLSRLLEENENYYLVFLGSQASIDALKKMQKAEGLSSRILFHPQVPRDQITFYCSMADIGLVYTWNPKWKSYWFAAPNKLMDVALAGLPLLTTSQPELKRFIEINKNGCFFDGDDYNKLVDAFKKLTQNMAEYKSGAKEVTSKYHWGDEKKKLLDLYAKLTS
ncbi:MAG: glycosyltransferase [Vicingaceae bacterium]